MESPNNRKVNTPTRHLITPYKTLVPGMGYILLSYWSKQPRRNSQIQAIGHSPQLDSKALLLKTSLSSQNTENSRNPATSNSDPIVRYTDESVISGTNVIGVTNHFFWGWN